MSETDNANPQQVKQKPNTFEILLAENMSDVERVKNSLPAKGLIVKEKISHSAPQVKYHIIDEKEGIVKLIKDIEAGKE
jgi:hypothetical protein